MPTGCKPCQPTRLDRNYTEQHMRKPNTIRDQQAYKLAGLRDMAPSRK